MPQDKNVAAYQMRVTFEFRPVNKYGDHLDAPQEVTFIKPLKIKNMTELGVVLARIDELGE